jgi:hypothetical protein
MYEKDYVSAEKYCKIAINSRNNQIDIQNLQIIKNLLKIYSSSNN